MSATPATIGFLPAVQVGNLPQAAAFDPATDTIYVANQNDNTVSVINGAKCNGTDTSGCSPKPPTVAAGPTPFGIAVDRQTDTLYVADANFDANGNPQAGSVAVIDGATCNATVTSGCAQQPGSVPVGNFPFIPFFDPTTGTVYVTNANDNTISMIDARTCNATDTAGCDHVPTAATDSNPIPVLVNDRTRTLYVGSANSPLVDVLDARTCNAERASGCGVLGRVAIAGGTDGMAIDAASDTLFVANNGPGTSPAMERSVSVIDTSACDARDTRGCGQSAPTVLTGANPGQATVDPATNTLYQPTFDNTLEVINGATCNEHIQTGCGQPVPATLAGKNPISVAIDPSTSSVYVGDAGEFEGLPWAITVLDDATCNALQQSGCTASPATFTTPFLALGPSRGARPPSARQRARLPPSSSSSSAGTPTWPSGRATRSGGFNVPMTGCGAVLAPTGLPASTANTPRQSRSRCRRTARRCSARPIRRGPCNRRTGASATRSSTTRQRRRSAGSSPRTPVS